jgi:hypothetical protein
MSKKATLLILSFTLFVVIYLSFKLKADEDNRIEKFGEQGIGTISHHGFKTIDISYSIEGKEYTYIQGIPFATLVEGEQYSITVFKKDPSRILVHMDKRFIDTVQYKWQKTKPIRMEQISFNQSQWKFGYDVGQNSYKRIQKVTLVDDDLVEAYRVDKPEIAYLTSGN